MILVTPKKGKYNITCYSQSPNKNIIYSLFLNKKSNTKKTSNAKSKYIFLSLALTRYVEFINQNKKIAEEKQKK